MLFHDQEPVSDLAVDEEEPKEPTKKRDRTRKISEASKPDEKGLNTPLLSTEASIDSLSINDDQSQSFPSSAELVKTSPRNSVRKTAVKGDDEVNQPSVQATDGVRSKGQKRLPLADATKNQAAKRNRLNGAISQLQARAGVIASPLEKKNSPENAQDTAPSTEEPQKAAPKKRRQRKTKEDASVRTKKSEQGDSAKKKNEWKEHVRGLVKEVLEITGHSTKDNVAQAIFDVVVEGVPLAISAARQGLSESYLQNFVRATAVHIRQQCPELMQNLAD
ncbi:hypothetical protein Y032_0109g129 [Ancylostoma ceylanicum]|uniref:Uncharacterized protein n=1 Tax=Ancylostoma ceylanicum TaxID=53326 RepID=A0A016TF31_9BILA|nr:hypothetical protein Y032_0109g129 [Ancylostoma ceylanicum]